MQRRVAMARHRRRTSLPLVEPSHSVTVTRPPTNPLPIIDEHPLPIETEETLESVKAQLESASREISHLKEILARSTHDGVNITIPVPAITGAGLTADNYETVKTFYSGIVLEMIRTAYSELEKKNKQGYGFYRLVGDSNREIALTVAVTSDPKPEEVVAVATVATAMAEAVADAVERS